MNSPKLRWDVSTGYDMFVSLQVLHDPGRYGLRGAWAAGVRSRLPEREREFLHEATSLFIPFYWIYHLPEPKDAAAVLKTLAAIPAGERLAQMTFRSPVFPQRVRDLFGRVASSGAWHDDDLTALKQSLGSERADVKKKQLVAALNLWSRPVASGELFLSALTAYQEVFFAEEEQRIRPVLEAAAETGRRQAAELPLLALLEELSQGLRFSNLPDYEQIVLVPSFWSTPLVADHRLTPGRLLFLYGARPRHISLVPGEPVPDDLHRALKAVADPTRLRILHYLAAEPLTPTQLADRLRLRAPTVVHHLHLLRMARLVRLTVEVKDKRRYMLLEGAVEALFGDLQQFIEEGGPEG